MKQEKEFDFCKICGHQDLQLKFEAGMLLIPASVS
jgi:rRNA maturation endonuclease Nob1